MRATLARLLGRRRRYRELEGLHEISEAFATMTDIGETYGRLTRRLAELVGAGKCAISLYDPATREIVGQAPGYNVPDEYVRDARYPADVLREAWNFRTQGPMVNKRPEEFGAIQRKLLEPFEPLYNMTEVPLVHEGRFIGKVSVGNKPGGFSENDVHLLTVFAAQAAIAIQNARLYTRLQESASHLEANVRARTAELEATNRQLAESHARLRELDQLKSDFLGNVSHELRTPLAAIKGFVDNLLDGVRGPVSDPQRHYLVRVKENVDRLARMVADLLDLTRIEAGKIELLLEPVDAAEAVVEAAEALRPLARSRGIRLAVEPGSCAALSADRDKLHRVLTNLVSNALKFTPPGGEVTVAAADAGGRVRLMVRDTGPGIPVTDRVRIFDKFYQVGQVGGDRPSGSGLGLTITRHLVELHGGRIYVEGDAGAGSVFVVELPAAPEARS